MEETISHLSEKEQGELLSDQVPITINYEHINHLPMLHAYKRIYITVNILAMTGCVTC